MFNAPAATIVSFLILASGAAAQEAPPAHDPSAALEEAPPADPLNLRVRDPNKWQVDIEPSVWFAGISGNIRLPRSTAGNSPEVNLEDLNLDNPRFEPLAEINVRRGNWRGTIRGAIFEADKEASGLSGRLGDVTFSSANTVHTSLGFTAIELEGAYTVLGKPQVVDGRVTLDPRIDALAGVRVYGQDIDFENISTGASQSTSDWYVHPLVGVKLDMEFYKDFTIDVQATVGGLPGGTESYGVDVMTGFQWRPTPHVGVQIGYRALFFRMSSGDGNDEASLEGTVQGLFGGITVRF